MTHRPDPAPAGPTHLRSVGPAGDVFLCHPLLVHNATWPHPSTGPRMIAQPRRARPRRVRGRRQRPGTSGPGRHRRARPDPITSHHSLASGAGKKKPMTGIRAPISQICTSSGVAGLREPPVQNLGDARFPGWSAITPGDIRRCQCRARAVRSASRAVRNDGPARRRWSRAFTPSRLACIPAMRACPPAGPGRTCTARTARRWR